MRSRLPIECAAVACVLIIAAGCGNGGPAEVTVEDTAALNSTMVERGEYLVEGIAGCGNCHTPRDEDGELIQSRNMAGSYVIEEPIFTAYAPNITPDLETGVGSWTDDELVLAIREGIHPDGRILGPPMAFESYRQISDTDINAIVAYLRTVPAVENVVPRSQYNVPLPESWGPPLGQVADVSEDDPVAYGAYLAGPLGHCMECHTPLVDGQLVHERVGEGGNIFPTPFGFEFTAVSSNITSHQTLGIGAWSDDEIKTAIADGVGRNGGELLPFMGFSYYNKMSDQDLDAIVAYLRTLPPQPPAQ